MSAVRAPVAVVSTETALEVAETYPIFPCDLSKRPLTANGFKAATKDAEAITRWWKQHPDALIGVPTGETTRLVVIDYDPDKANADTREWVEQWASLLAGTFGTETPRGGKHWYFQAADAYASGANIWLDGKKRAGLDVRANGGYVIYWPAHGLALFDNPIAILPPTLIADRKRVIPKDRAIPKRQRELLVRARSWAQERDRVVKALAFVDPADRDNWLRIGLAIHAACSGHDDGFAVWHAWSAGGLTGDVPASYCSEHDCRYHWQSFNLDTASKRDLVTLGTLFKLAQDGGYESRPVPPLPPDLEPWLPAEHYTDADIPEWREADHEPEPDKPDATGHAPNVGLFRPLAEIVAEQREVEWLPGLYKILERRVLAIVAGRRGTFKSFIALHWALSAAQAGAKVALLSGEGGGLGQRVEAWKLKNSPKLDFAGISFVALEYPLDLTLAETLERVASELSALDGTVDLIVIDTFSKFVGGLDENSNPEVAQFLSMLSAALRDRLQATVLLIAHAGHGDAGRPRGASTLMANPDAEYIVDRPLPTGMQVSVSRERYKDSPSMPALCYAAEVVELGRVDQYSEAVTSLAMVDAEPLPMTPVKAAGAHQHKALTALAAWAGMNPEQEIITGCELAALFKSQHMPRQRILDVKTWLLDVKILAPTAMGFAVNRDDL